MKKSLTFCIWGLVLVKSVVAIEYITEPWSIPVQIAINDKMDTLWFGTHVNATDSLDVNIDEIMPPPPPFGGSPFFEIEGLFSSLQKDYRSNIDSTNTWNLH